MAKHLYEEERIKDIAKKIRELAPGLRDGLFTTSEMPNGIERVFEEGERKGRTAGFTEGYGSGYNSGVLRGKEEGYDDGYNKGHEEGYHKGYTDGAEDNQGVELPKLTTPGTADDLVEGKQLIDGEGNIVEGAIPVRTSDNVGVIGDEVVVPEGYYAETVSKAIETDIFYNAGYNAGYSKGETDGYTGGYTTGYNIGLTDGAEKLKTDEARTSDNVTYSVNNASVTVTIESGYYAENTEKVIEGDDLDPITDRAYDEGLVDGGTYVKTTEARTAADLVFERLGTYDLGLTVTSGYYGEGVTKIIDVEPYYDEGYDKGLNDGLTAGAGTYEDGNGVKY